MTDPRNAFPRASAEEEACFRIIIDYGEGRLTLEDAAPRLQGALRALPGGINLTMSPSVRRLFAEIARLEGQTPPFLGPDPDRHAGGGRDLRHHLAPEAWRAVTNHPRRQEALSISYHFCSATEATTRALVDWLNSRGQQHIEVRSPTEADTDDWTIRASTPPTFWSRSAIDQWAEMVTAAPLAGEASFMGWGV